MHHTAHSTSHTARPSPPIPTHYTLHTAYCITYNRQWTVCTTLQHHTAAHNTRHLMTIVHRTVCGVQCTVYDVRYTVYGVRCTVYSVQCTSYTVPNTTYNIPHSAPYILYATHHTPHTYTLHTTHHTPHTAHLHLDTAHRTPSHHTPHRTLHTAHRTPHTTCLTIVNLFATSCPDRMT